VDKLRGENEGFIIRTAATGATRRHFKTESEFLKRIYRSVLETAKTAPFGAVVYRECDLPVKVMRDSLGEDVSRVVVGNEDLYRKILNLARFRSDLNEKKIIKYTGEMSMLTEYGLDAQIYRLASSDIPLENGASLVLDRTEAMTVFDVNTGKFVGENNLEDTVFETNLLASREIARQVRLRNIGGIIAVDFIDMTDENHRIAVGEALEQALSADRAKCRVLPMSDLCVTLFTRKRTSPDLASFLLQPCAHCTRRGYVLSDIYMAMRIRGAILSYFADGYVAVIIDLNRGLMNKILSERYFTEELAGEWRHKRVYMVPHTSYQVERVEIRGDNAPVLTLPDRAQLLY